MYCSNHAASSSPSSPPTWSSSSPSSSSSSLSLSSSPSSKGYSKTHYQQQIVQALEIHLVASCQIEINVATEMDISPQIPLSSPRVLIDRCHEKFDHEFKNLDATRHVAPNEHYVICLYMSISLSIHCVDVHLSICPFSMNHVSVYYLYSMFYVFIHSQIRCIFIVAFCMSVLFTIFVFVSTSL